MIDPTWNDQFKLPDGSYSVSNIQDYIEFSIKKNKTLTKIPPIHVYINKVKNRLALKNEEGYKLQLQTPKTMVAQQK